MIGVPPFAGFPGKTDGGTEGRRTGINELICSGAPLSAPSFCSTVPSHLLVPCFLYSSSILTLHWHSSWSCSFYFSLLGKPFISNIAILLSDKVLLEKNEIDNNNNNNNREDGRSIKWLREFVRTKTYFDAQ